MKRIIKDETPDFWRKYVRKHPNITYKKAYQTEAGSEVIAKLRDHIACQQKFICCYCCGRISAKNKLYHNEHIKPKDHYAKLSMDYNNILVSCSSPNSCGMNKKNNYNETMFISPLQEDCETHFLFQADGCIVGITEQGKYTIDILNLNCKRLVDERAALYNSCCRMAECGCADYIKEEYITEKNGQLPEYVDMVKFFFDKGVFEALSPSEQ